MRHGIEIAQAYATGELNGWGGEKLARQAFEFLSASMPGFHRSLQLVGQTRSTASQKVRLWDYTRKFLGNDTPNYAQQIGDCVSFGAKNAQEYLTATQAMLAQARLNKIMAGQLQARPGEIAALQSRIKWRPCFPPYNYGTSRVLIGKGNIPANEDGSTGAWMAAAVMQYGSLFADETGVPAYSGSIAKQWGAQGPPTNFVTDGKQYLVHSTALIQSFADLGVALANGYPVPVASNVGYEMTARSDGFHHRSQPWGHQMCFIGIGYTPEPYAIILNNWGDVHGQLTDFDDKSNLPVGVLRVRQKDAEAHITAGESYAYSHMDCFQEQLPDLEQALFESIAA